MPQRGVEGQQVHMPVRIVGFAYSCIKLEV